MENATFWYVFVNPHAGSFKKWPEVASHMLAYKLPFKKELTQTIEELNSRVHDLIVSGARKFIAVGGDGSCHVLINALLKQDKVAREDLVFANISCGTGNDWQRGRGWPKGLKQQVALIEKGRLEAMDLGVISYHHLEKVIYFFNMLGLSYDAYVVQNLAAQGKKKMGVLIYLWSIVKYIFKYKIPILRLEFDDHILEKKLYTVNVGLGTHAGSGMQICPHAKDRKDRFAILVANDMSKARVLIESIRFYTGRITHSAKTETYFTKEIKAEAIDVPLLVEADGEFLYPGPITVRICPKHIKTIAI